MEWPFLTECSPVDARIPFVAEPQREQPNKPVHQRQTSACLLIPAPTPLFGYLVPSVGIELMRHRKYPAAQDGRLISAATGSMQQRQYTLTCMSLRRQGAIGTMINFRQLEVLKTLITTGSTIATAKAMGLSQSGVSRLLQQLETEVSLKLFERDKGRLIATPEATILARDAETILLGLNRFSGLVEDLRSGAKGPELVRLALPSSMWENFAPAMLATYMRDYPSVRVETFFETASSIARLVEQKTIDFGFLRCENKNLPGIDVEVVATGTSVCVMPEAHPLASLAKVTPKDLRGIPLILTGRQRPARILMDQIFRKAAVKQNVKIETHTNSSACAYVAHGLGVAILSSFFANLYRNLPIVQRPFVPATTQEYVLATPSGTSSSLAAKALMDALKRQIAISQNEVYGQE